MGVVAVNTIVIPQRQILLPRFEFPAWLRNPKEDAVARFGTPMGAGAFTQAMGGGTTSWWLAGGVSPTLAVAAYAPKGAASFAASKINLVLAGTHNAANGTSFPTWDVTNGWISNGTSQVLTTDIQPNANTSVLIRFTGGNATAATRDIIGETDNVVGGLEVRPNATGSGGRLVVGHGIASGAATPGMTAGTLLITPSATYRNGVLDFSYTANWTGVTTKNIFICSVNSNGTAGNFWQGNIQAVAIYSGDVAAQQTALYNSINAL